MIIRIFAAREPAKPLNDAQMCGSFLFLWVYGNKNSVCKIFQNRGGRWQVGNAEERECDC